MKNRQPQYLKILWSNAPLSWAVIRAMECELISKLHFTKPILEIGCGDGLVSQKIFNKKNSIDTGIDINEKELKRAKETGIYECVLLSDITKSNLKSSYYNTVFANGVLEHIPNLDACLVEIERVLKKNGRLITTSPTSYFTSLLFLYGLLKKLGLSSLANTYGRIFNGLFSHIHLLTESEWEKKLSNVGLTVEKYIYYNSRHTVWLHELSLPFAVGSKTIKSLTNSMVLFPKAQKLKVNLLSPLIQKYLDTTMADDYGSLLIVATKK